MVLCVGVGSGATLSTPIGGMFHLRIVDLLSKQSKRSDMCKKITTTEIDTLILIYAKSLNIPRYQPYKTLPRGRLDKPLGYRLTFRSVDILEGNFTADHFVELLLALTQLLNPRILPQMLHLLRRRAMRSMRIDHVAHPISGNDQLPCTSTDQASSTFWF